jgi:hypothetical protein
MEYMVLFKIYFKMQMDICLVAVSLWQYNTQIQISHKITPLKTNKEKRQVSWQNYRNSEGYIVYIQSSYHIPFQPKTSWCSCTNLMTHLKWKLKFCVNKPFHFFQRKCMRNVYVHHWVSFKYILSSQAIFCLTSQGTSAPTGTPRTSPIQPYTGHYK